MIFLFVIFFLKRSCKSLLFGCSSNSTKCSARRSCCRRAATLTRRFIVFSLSLYVSVCVGTDWLCVLSVYTNRSNNRKLKQQNRIPNSRRRIHRTAAESVESHWKKVEASFVCHIRPFILFISKYKWKNQENMKVKKKLQKQMNSKKLTTKLEMFPLNKSTFSGFCLSTSLCANEFTFRKIKRLFKQSRWTFEN